MTTNAPATHTTYTRAERRAQFETLTQAGMYRIFRGYQLSGLTRSSTKTDLIEDVLDYETRRGVVA